MKGAFLLENPNLEFLNPKMDFTCQIMNPNDSLEELDSLDPIQNWIPWIDDQCHLHVFTLDPKRISVSEGEKVKTTAIRSVELFFFLFFSRFFFYCNNNKYLHACTLQQITPYTIEYIMLTTQYVCLLL